MTGPCVEEVAGRDGPARPQRLPDSPVLVEGGSAYNGGRVGSRGLVDVVRTAIAGHSALVGPRGTGVIPAPVVNDVVLHERARRPPVEGQIGVAGWAEAA